MSRFFLLFFFCLTGFTTVSYAQENPYVVENVTAEAAAKSPIDAKNLATKNARRDAFLILLTRLELDVSMIDSIGDEEISDMVKSEQVNDERIAGNNYSATFTIGFSQNFVDHTLNKKPIKTASPVILDPVIIIPVIVSNNKITLWENDNDWKNALQKEVDQKSMKKLIFLNPDIENISTINASNINNLEFHHLNSLASKYGSNLIVLALFEYDSIENKAIINLIELRKLQKKQVKLNFVNVNQLDSFHLFEKVAQKTVDYISKLPTKISSDSKLIKINIINNRLNNWMTIKNKIETNHLASQISIESISHDLIIISLNYTGSEFGVIETFAKIGIPMQQIGENHYLISLK